MTFDPEAYRKAARALWDFGGIDYMNHGSFGACPKPVQDFVQEQRAALMRNPIEYFDAETPRRMAAARAFWASFAGAEAEGIVNIECATLGVNTVLKSLALRGYFKNGDEILLTRHGYNACNNAAREIASFTGAKVVVADIPFPLDDPEQATRAILGTATNNTRLALIDHITSETALIFPIGHIVAALKERGIETLVDGAHAPAQVPLALDELGAAFYTGNGHKWLCGAPGCAFLYVREDFRDLIRPLSTSHGANDPSPEMSFYQKTFAWTGTRDVTPYFTPKVAFDTLSSLHPDGLQGVVACNRALVREGYRLLLDVLGAKPHAPESMMGTMATLLLPPGDAMALRTALRQRYNFVTQLAELSPQFGKGRFLRISAQAYNTPDQYRRLANALGALLEDEKQGKL